MKYYRVYTGFTEYIPIDSTEMEKAMYAFITGEPISFMNGATTRIDRIVPDFNREMGWNPSHKLEGDDWNEIHSYGIDRKYQNAIGKAKEKVLYLIETNQRHLIGKNVAIPELQAKPDQKVIEGTTNLATKLKI